jgi:hypothetical protein
MEKNEKPIIDKGINEVKSLYTTGNIAPSGVVFEAKHLEEFKKKVK